MNREDRQHRVHTWAKAAFGIVHATSLPQRGLRLLEEAVELFQACGGDLAMANKLVAFVFSRPPGTVAQELGGVGVTTLALAAAAGLSADDMEQREVDRVLSKPPEEFAARNAAKNAAGFSYSSGATAAVDSPVVSDPGRMVTVIVAMDDALTHVTRERVRSERMLRIARESSKAFEALAQRYFEANRPLELIADAALDLLRLISLDGDGDQAIAYRAGALRDALSNRQVDADAAAMLASMCSDLGPTHNED